MKIVQQWKTIMGTRVYVTDDNIRYIVNPSPVDHRGNPMRDHQLVEAYRADNPDRKLGMALVPKETPIEKWGQCIWGARPPRTRR